jgi:hypothetical protein
MLGQVNYLSTIWTTLPIANRLGSIPSPWKRPDIWPSGGQDLIVNPVVEVEENRGHCCDPFAATLPDNG